jgi:uncharacterized membrane protein
MGRSFTATTLALWGALLAWGAYFLLVYVATALFCERGIADERVFGFRIIPAMVVAAFVVALGITGVLVGTAWRRQRAAGEASRRFLDFVASVLGLLALAALVWTTLPPILLDTGCA